MSKIIFFIGFVCTLQLASCHVIREAPAADATTLTLKDLTTKAETAYDNLHEGILKFANVNSDAELTSLVRNQTEQYADKLKTLAGQFTDEFKANSEKFDGAFKSFIDSFTATANKLKEENPQLASFQENLEKGFKNILDESEKLTTKIKEDGQVIPENCREDSETSLRRHMGNNPNCFAANQYCG
ncbi:hypothetical protein HA402_000379 [Bradysia odoriphaga]|nr:hypothetical protein HA402_000379 [Bradysia odoriphaga]